jgi:hypothetical protein
MFASNVRRMLDGGWKTSSRFLFLPERVCVADEIS